MTDDYPMSVSITGGATPQSYKITDSKGNEIKNITGIQFQVAVDELATATINFYHPSVSVENVQAYVPFDQLMSLAMTHGFVLVPEENSQQNKMAYDSLQRFVRSHGYELVKGDSSEPFFEEP